MTKPSFTYQFKQQIMKSWQPVPTLNSTLCLFFVLTAFFLTMGIVLEVYSDSVQETYQRYDVLCKYQTECTVNIALEEEMYPPIYVYYELTNLYQNHRLYVKSKSLDQLSGQNVDVDSLSACDPAITNSDLGKNESYTKVPLNASAPAVPCGLIAKSMFNDQFRLFWMNQTDGFYYNVTIYEDSIAWPSDKNGMYKNVPNSENVQWIDMENNEHFMVWMRTAGLPEFRKLWGRIKNSLPAGNYIINITNNYNVTGFEGSKAFVLSTVNVFGGKNQFLAYAYIVVGVISGIIFIGFSVKKHLEEKIY